MSIKVSRLTKRSPVAFLLVLILAFTAVQSMTRQSFAWLFFFTSSSNNVFQTSEGVEIEVERFHYETDQWTLAVVDETGEISDLHMGSIDNISQLKEENHAYYRLKIPSVAGGDIDFTLQYNKGDTNGRGYDFYTDGVDGADFTLVNDSDIYNQLKLIEYDEEGNPISGSCFLSYRLALSESDTLDSIDFSQSDSYEMFGEKFLGDFDRSHLLEYFYLYIKISPNIDSLIDTADYMPCIFEFHLKIDLEVRDMEGL